MRAALHPFTSDGSEVRYVAVEVPALEVDDLDAWVDEAMQALSALGFMGAAAGTQAQLRAGLVAAACRRRPPGWPLACAVFTAGFFDAPLVNLRALSADGNAAGRLTSIVAGDDPDAVVVMQQNDPGAGPAVVGVHPRVRSTDDKRTTVDALVRVASRHDAMSPAVDVVASSDDAGFLSLMRSLPGICALVRDGTIAESLAGLRTQGTAAM